MTTTNVPQPTSPLMSAMQVAQRLSVSVDAVYKWKRQGLLRFKVLGKRAVRFDPEDVEAFIRGERATDAKVVPMRGRRG